MLNEFPINEEYLNGGMPIGAASGLIISIGQKVILNFKASGTIITIAQEVITKASGPIITIAQEVDTP